MNVFYYLSNLFEANVCRGAVFMEPACLPSVICILHMEQVCLRCLNESRGRTSGVVRPRSRVDKYKRNASTIVRKHLQHQHLPLNWTKSRYTTPCNQNAIQPASLLHFLRCGARGPCGWSFTNNWSPTADSVSNNHCIPLEGYGVSSCNLYFGYIKN